MLIKYNLFIYFNILIKQLTYKSKRYKNNYKEKEEQR